MSKHTGFGNEIDDDVSFQLIGYSPLPEKIFKIILEGCLKRRRLELTYQSPARDEKSVRTVDPYHLCNYMGTWHLIGFCHMRGMIRDFVLGRVSEGQLLDDVFEKPFDFNVNDYFLSSFGIYKGKSKIEVTLWFTPEKSKWIKDQIWHKEQKAKFLRDGSLELSFPVSDFSEIKMEILRHGDQVKVIAPKRLRNLIRDEAEKIAKIYGNARTRI